MADRRINIRSGKKEVWLEVTEEEYQSYYRPWWQQKKREQRNREAMEEQGYTEESYEAWRDNSADDMGIRDMDAESIEELLEKKMLLGILEEALESLLPDERELAEKVIGERMPLIDFANMKKKNPRTLSDHKRKVLSKLRDFFIKCGVDINED
ncbi:sigma-70 family RNA polymerase sigma factor [Enterocloster clostridioformis]|uniref:sigma-70 family RNA polymerase sigma factor n=1 Tax=Enterocloster clostridioformis TaxID=1531 RepID=UPI0022E5B957|nr:sigma-70 family RNA polymerase sigma factor [Enterocloster clostridioformis]